MNDVNDDNMNGSDEIDDEADEAEAAGSKKEKAGEKWQKAMEDAYKPLSEFTKKLGKKWQPSTKALDVIFGGRFLGSTSRKEQSDQAFLNGFHVDAAASFAHAFTTNATSFDPDYFVAMDDLDKTRSSSHIGNNEYGSGCFYFYSCIDLNKVELALGSPEAAAEAVAALLDVLLDAEPAARQTTAAAKTQTTLVFAAIRSSPLNLCGAFERPVVVQEGSEYSQSELSAAMLDKHWRELARYAGTGKRGRRFVPEAAAIACSSEKAAELLPSLAPYLVDSTDAVLETIEAAIIKGGFADPGSKPAGRFLDISLLKAVPTSCLNRDDQNMPKRCDIGGFTRMRISSQCFKRAARLLLRKRHDGIRAYRSKAIHTEILKKLGIDDGDPCGRLAVMSFFSNTITKIKAVDAPLSKDAAEATDALVFMGQDEIDSMAQMLREAWPEIMPLAVKAYEAGEAVRLKMEAEAAEAKSARSAKDANGASAKPAKKGKGAKAKVPS